MAAAESTCAAADISGDDTASQNACTAQGACSYVLSLPGDGSSCADVCGVPDGDNTTCHDICDVPNGNTSTCLDPCGVPAGNGSSCADVCGVPHGDGTSCADACGVPTGNGDSCRDRCNVPHGDGSSCVDDCGVPYGDGSQCAYSCDENMYIDLGSGDLFGGGVGSFQDDLSTMQDLYVGSQDASQAHAGIEVAAAPDITLTLHSLVGGQSTIRMMDPVSTFSVEKDGSVLRLDASADAQGEVHVTPGASGRLRVGNDKLTVSGADGSTTVAGNVEVGNAADAGVARSLRIFEPSGASLTMTADTTSQLVLTSASATDSTKITMGGGAQSFELVQLGSTLSIGANDADGSVEARPGSSGRFAVVSSSAAELVAVDGTSGNTAIAGSVSVGGPGLTGSRVLSVGTGSGDASIDLSSGGGGRAAGLVLTSSSPSGISSDHHIKKTECPDRDGLPRPDCSSLRIDAEDSGSDGEIRLLASEIHTDDGHLMVNQLTVRSARAVGFQGQTIDLNSGRVESGASILAPSPGLAAPNDPIPTETISINNERITPTSVVMASVVSQCNDRTGVTVISTDAGIGSVEFTVANFGTRACGGGNINLDERYIINFYLVGDTNARF